MVDENDVNSTEVDAEDSILNREKIRDSNHERTWITVSEKFGRDMGINFILISWQ